MKLIGSLCLAGAILSSPLLFSLATQYSNRHVAGYSEAQWIATQSLRDRYFLAGIFGWATLMTLGFVSVLPQRDNSFDSTS